MAKNIKMSKKYLIISAIFAFSACLLALTSFDYADASSGVVVNAGGSRQVNQTQSITLNASAYDINGLPLTYSWSCTGGSLSNSFILNPVYYAPSAIYDTTYTCTLTARNSYGVVTSDAANILIKGQSNGGAYVGNNLYVKLVPSPSSGVAPLTNVSLAATVSGNTNGEMIVYKFDCDNDGTWETIVQTTATSYTAYNACNYYTGGSYIARVMIQSNGYSATNSVSVSVTDANNNLDKNNYLLSVNAGSNIDINQGQTTTLSGSYFDSNYYYVTSYWSCTGGSLSTPYSLNPTYYAPNVSADTTYVCTLYATNNHGISNSDSISVTVRKSGSGVVNGTTGDAGNVTTNSAVLKGTVLGDAGHGVAVRFDWGTTASYGNVTEWSYNNRAGDVVSTIISSLSKGKGYHYRVEIYDGSTTFTGKDMVFVTRPDSPDNVSAIGLNSSQVKVSWDRSGGSCKYMVIRNKANFPVNTADGSVAYYGTLNTFTDKSLSSNSTYYYRVWAVGCGSGMYSFSDSSGSQVSAITYPVYSSNPTTTVTTPSASVSQSQTVVQQQTSSDVVLEVLARNITQKETDWNNPINANPSDQIEFNVIITPKGSADLNNVIVSNKLSDKIGSVSDLKIGDQSYSGSINSINVGTVSAGSSKVITFMAKINQGSDFDYGSTDIVSTSQISADGVSPIAKNLTVSVTKGLEAGASLANSLGTSAKIYIIFSILTFLIMLGFIFHLIIDRRKLKRECVPVDADNGSEAEGNEEVKKSKYFIIKQ